MTSPQRVTTSSPSCDGKFLYSNRKRAARAATNLRHRIYDSTGGWEPIHAYKCDLHHGFHVGHPVGWRREAGVPRPKFRVAL